MDGLADVLLGADHDGKDDEDDGGVQVVQAVDPVVIVATLQAGISRKTPQDAVKPAKTHTNTKFPRSIVSVMNMYKYALLLHHYHIILCTHKIE